MQFINAKVKKNCPAKIYSHANTKLPQKNVENTLLRKIGLAMRKVRSLLLALSNVRMEIHTQNHLANVVRVKKCATS